MSATCSDALKLERVVRALAPFRDPGLAIELAAPTARLGYRTRARLAFTRGPSGVSIGYREAWGKDVVDVDRCAVLAPALDASLAVLRARLAPLLVGRGEVRLGVHDGLGTVFVETNDAQPPPVFTALSALVSERALAGAALLAGGATVAARFGAEVERTEDLEGRVIDRPLGGFGQAHGEHNRQLAEYVLALADAPGARVLELFAGHGNFSLALAARAATLSAVELDREAAACLRANLARHGLSAQVVESDAAAAVKSGLAAGIDLVVLDPPREGAHEVARALNELPVARVVYVSCDVTSLGRDLAILAEGGFVLDAARAFDMFPQTAHVEVAVRMTRRPGALAARPRRR